MATDTHYKLRNQVIYEVFVRNHSAEGNFQGLQKDLARIRNLGVDIIWLMPIHPIGELHRKKSLGCPYSIRDYRAINPEYGTLEDFKSLVQNIHRLGLQVMMDIVFNHTSHDSWLVYHHPEWFYHNPNGEIAGRVEDWTDIVDLDYSHPELRSYLIETLKLWAKEGVDGFRCDVASLVPVEFWQQARAELKKINPGIIWLAESSDPDFILKMRSLGWNAQSDGELFQAFDITYDYDVYHTFQAYLHGQVPQKEYLFRLRQQESIYPQNYLKLRFIENHDQPRIRSLIFTEECWRQWAAFSFFEKGVALIYSGQETRDPKQPSLFEKDIFDWGTLDPETSNFFKKLSAIKKESIIGRGYYQIHHSSPLGVIRASYQTKPQILQGVFNVEGKCGFLKVDCKDGSYRNLIDGKEIQIQDGVMKLQNEPIIFYGETEP